MKNILKIIFGLVIVLAILLILLYLSISKEQKDKQDDFNKKTQNDIIKDIPCDGPPDVCLKETTVTNTNNNDSQDKDKINLEEVECLPEQREADVCIEIYQPVCATVNIQCITVPCNPIKETYANSCKACANSLVSSYTEGECLIN